MSSSPERSDVPVPVADERIPSPLGQIPDKFAALDKTSGSPDDGGPQLPTVAEVGNRLPIGFVDANGKRHREFELRKWDWTLEEEVAELLEKEADDLSYGAMLSEVISRSIARLGNLDVVKMKRSEKRLLMYRLYHADAMYLYLRARMDALGKTIKLEDFPCPICEVKIQNWVGDLATVEVKELAEIPREIVEVPGGFTYSGKKLTKMTISPLRWAFMETDESNVLTNFIKMKLATLQNTIVDLPELPRLENPVTKALDVAPPIYFTMEHLKSMSLSASRYLLEQVDLISGGPRFQIEGRCKSCSKRFFHDIDWRYEHFFGRSSA